MSAVVVKLTVCINTRDFCFQRHHDNHQKLMHAAASDDEILDDGRTEQPMLMVVYFSFL